MRSCLMLHTRPRISGSDITASRHPFPYSKRPGSRHPPARPAPDHPTLPRPNPRPRRFTDTHTSTSTALFRSAPLRAVHQPMKAFADRLHGLEAAEPGYGRPRQNPPSTTHPHTPPGPEARIARMHPRKHSAPLREPMPPTGQEPHSSNRRRTAKTISRLEPPRWCAPGPLAPHTSTGAMASPYT